MVLYATYHIQMGSMTSTASQDHAQTFTLILPTNPEGIIKKGQTIGRKQPR